MDTAGAGASAVCVCAGPAWTCEDTKYTTGVNLTLAADIGSVGVEGSVARKDWVDAFEADLEAQLSIPGGVKVRRIMAGSVVVELSIINQAVDPLSELQAKGKLKAIASIEVRRTFSV
jgi:hypothetical protein